MEAIIGENRTSGCPLTLSARFDLYRERAIARARAVQRDPALPLN
jgi:hypothetical protein